MLGFYDGGSMASPKITGLNEFAWIMSSTNMLFLHFHSDDDIQNDVVFYLEYLSYDSGKYFFNY